MVPSIGSLRCVLCRVSIKAESYKVIELLEFEANVKGIIIDDHKDTNRAAVVSRCMIFVLVEAAHVLVQPQFVATSMAEEREMFCCVP